MYLEPRRTSVMKFFYEKVPIFQKCSIVDALVSSKCASELNLEHCFFSSWYKYVEPSKQIHIPGKCFSTPPSSTKRKEHYTKFEIWDRFILPISKTFDFRTNENDKSILMCYYFSQFSIETAKLQKQSPGGLL